MKAVTLIGRLVEGVRKKGQASVDDMGAMLPDYERKQILNALDNARRRDLVKIKTPSQNGKGGHSAIYEVSDGKKAKPKLQTVPGVRTWRPRERVAYVFDMAAGPVAIPEWKQPARAYQPLGGWGEADGA